jgi:hypothetical protein
MLDHCCIIASPFVLCPKLFGTLSLLPRLGFHIQMYGTMAK